MALSREQIEAYDRDGFLVVEDVLSADEIAELRRVTDDFTAPADGCASYQALYGRLADLERDTFRHIHLENNVLFEKLTG